ncbi:hypothetical protein BWK59_12085 [Flavobacterium davisii]|uniref:Uncharacterized protein n=1 Tax=Flavobacterium davisii TaxID=2906077 RepID=A0A246GG51_9FLAO|nr:hypothetical protein [Flavobacterium davisii]OWP83145.1 hypothetical protein BWK59_12085 [Flavobacterium davisii]
MIQHTKKTLKLALLMLVVFTNLSCKENTSKDREKSINTTKSKVDSSIDTIINLEKDSKNILVEDNYTSFDEWVFSKCASISNPQDCNENKYEDFKFKVSNDSIFINNNYTDNVISGELKSDLLYKKYGISKEFLLKNFNISLPDRVKYIRNPRAYDSNSPLENFFRDAFYIDNYIVFQVEGCIYCFKNVKVKEARNDIKKINLPISSNTILNIKTNVLNKNLFNDYSCGDTPRGYYLGKKDTYDVYIVSNDCGDFPFKDLITVKSNSIISKINIEGDSWDIEKEEKKKIRDENITLFSIDADFKISIQNINKLNDKEKSKSISNFIIVNGKFTKK